MQGNNLKEEFDAILANLESVAGWKLARVKRPVLILGSLDGVETGIRQLIRDDPLETKEVFVKGNKIVVPTEEEILRIKGALIIKRNATRDFVDFAALAHFLGEEELPHGHLDASTPFTRRKAANPRFSSFACSYRTRFPLIYRKTRWLITKASLIDGRTVSP